MQAVCSSHTLYVALSAPSLSSGEVSPLAPSCQDEASASLATPRMTTMEAAAAAAERAPWQEARALCLKTARSGRLPSLLLLLLWMETRGLVLSVFSPVRMPRATLLPSLPAVIRGHPASGLVNRKWGEAASHKSQAGNDRAVSWAHGSQLTVDRCGTSATFPRPTLHISPSAEPRSLASGSGQHALSSCLPVAMSP